MRECGHLLPYSRRHAHAQPQLAHYTVSSHRLPAPVRPQIPTSAAAGARAENASSASVSSDARYLWQSLPRARKRCAERESLEWSTACAGGWVHERLTDAS